MAWICFHVAHGPGHQSSFNHYAYFKRATEEVLEDFIHTEILCRDLDWPIVKSKRIKRPPVEYFKERITLCRNIIANRKIELQFLKREMGKLYTDYELRSMRTRNPRKVSGKTPSHSKMQKG